MLQNTIKGRQRPTPYGKLTELLIRTIQQKENSIQHYKMKLQLVLALFCTLAAEVDLCSFFLNVECVELYYFAKNTHNDFQLQIHYIFQYVAKFR